MLDVLGIKEAAKLVPMEEDQKPTDPVSENQNVLMMKPVKAFMYQDHQSHIMVHMSAMQDPKIMSLLQNNPMAQQLQAAMMSHINEHLGFEYRKQIEQQLGMSLPPQKDESGEDVNMDPEVEARLAPLLAQASQRLLASNMQQATQQQAAQQAQDPLVQLQQQELQIKQGDLQRKVTKDQTDAALKQEQLKIDALKTVTQMQNNKQESMLNLGVDVLKHLSTKQQAKSVQESNHLHSGLQTVLNKKREN